MKMQKTRMAFMLTITAAATMAPVMVLAAESPYTKPDDTWINLSGTAVDTGPSSFVLDYGKGTITVEMDDWSWYEKDGYGLIEGDKVTVYGKVDDGIAEMAKIEAGSVYVESLGSYFYADSADEEDLRYNVVTPIVPAYMELTGTVTSASEFEFTIDTDLQQMTVDTTSLSYDPLDEKGFQQINEGDLVTVTGDLDTDLVENMELMADSIVILDDQEEDTSS
ncbi:MAG: hypothetical protein U5L98_03650 [Halomonas sp.]|uniref:hypothetical protein n=1 Tax=Halomonas sp. TaxID=1486246 RepID=UPI002ACDFB13|nr:hypothetical protein [Halomonas sp.]MDZ7851756.1 hypothetical protein [Halomonas sp.]